MATIIVEINNRQYEMACEDGEEEHINSLAGTLDGNVRAMESKFGKIGDIRLVVMASLTVADQLVDAQKKMTTLKDEIEGLKESRTTDLEISQANEDKIATMLEATAVRLDSLTKHINSLFEKSIA